ncbi:MAG: serine hydrolase [Calditrichaeota bacterium]|nr:serine hydrolase [Calditrichota bacterium]
MLNYPRYLYFIISIFLLFGCRDFPDSGLEGSWQGILQLPANEEQFRLRLQTGSTDQYQVELTTAGDNRPVLTTFADPQTNGTLRFGDPEKAFFFQGRFADENHLSGILIRGRQGDSLLFTRETSSESAPGTWTGTIRHSAQKLGLQLRMKKNLLGGLEARMDCPQLKIRDMPLSAEKIGQDSMDLEIPFWKATFHAAIPADGQSLTGRLEWRLFDNPLPLLFLRPEPQYPKPREEPFLPVAQPEQAGFREMALQNLVQDLQRNQPPGVLSLLIARRGALVTEAYFNGAHREGLQDLGEVASSLTALLTGAAIGRGILPGADARVGDFFPSASFPTSLQVRHLLSMTAGFPCDDYSTTMLLNREKLFRGEDWLAPLLRAESDHRPGEQWQYCSGEVLLLGELLQRAYGRTLEQLADSLLFRPLLIQSRKWDYSPSAQQNCANGLHLRPLDLLKIGLLMLDSGHWQGQELLPPTWVEQSTTVQAVAEGSRIFAETYGYHWWLQNFSTPAGEVAGFFAAGDGGQFLFVLPSLELTVVFTGSNYGKRETALPVQLLQERILNNLR